MPLGVRSGIEQIGSGGEVLSYYQHVHGKPLVNGMIARVPSAVFDAYRARPAVLFLAGEDVAISETDMSELIDWVDAGYVLVHRDLLTAEQAQRILAALDAHPRLELLTSEDDLIGYRVRTDQWVILLRSTSRVLGVASEVDRIRAGARSIALIDAARARKAGHPVIDRPPFELGQLLGS